MPPACGRIVATSVRACRDPKVLLQMSAFLFTGNLTDVCTGGPCVAAERE